MILTTVRHYVGNQQQLEELKLVSERVVKGQKYQKETNGKILYRLSLNTPRYSSEAAVSFTPEIRLRMYELVEGVRAEGASVDISDGYGIGGSWLNTVFDYLFELSVMRHIYRSKQNAAVMIDGNQFDASSEVVMKKIHAMAEKLWENDSIMGLAIRDFVQLAADPFEDEMRRIDELYHLFAAPIIEWYNPEPVIETKNIHPAYSKFGDEIPGLWVFNLNAHRPSFDAVMSTVQWDTMQANLLGYEGDPYMSIRFRKSMDKHGKKVYSVVVPTTRVTRGTRFNRDTINKKAAELAKTSIGGVLRDSVGNLYNKEVLEKYFSREAVEETRTRLLDGFKNSKYYGD